MEFDEKQIRKIRMAMKCDEETAKQIIIDNNRIDKGEKLFELTPEQKKVAREMCGTGTRVVYNFTKRERKANTEKATLIEVLTQAIQDQEGATKIEVANAEREFTFLFNDTKYKVVLSAPRT